MEIADPQGAATAAPDTVPLDAAIQAVQSVVMMGEPAGTTVTGESTFEELGLTSLDFAEVLVALEETVGRAVDVESITEDLIKVGDLAKLALVAD